jgi:RNA ligase (TIGR02306 family)
MINIIKMEKKRLTFHYNNPIWMNMERKLASIQTIKDLRPIEGADAILEASVLGWNLVVRKTEFEVGDKCVFFEVDAVIPLMKGTEHLCKHDKPLRVRTIRLRGTLSQGVALPLSILPDGQYDVGQDVAEILGVQKWEPVVPAELSGKVKGTRPSWIPKTDEPRLQSDPEALAEAIELDLDMVGTVKMDGTSITCFIRDGEFGITSRNMELLETEGNSYWKAAREANIEQKMASYFPVCDGGFALQGEMAGPGIQGNRMGLPKLTLFWYNVVDLNKGVYKNHLVLKRFTEFTGLNMVKEVFRGKFEKDTTINSLLKMANDLNYDNGLPAEGIVWRSVEEIQSRSLKGRMSFKVISNIFLEKYKE